MRMIWMERGSNTSLFQGWGQPRILRGSMFLENTYSCGEAKSRLKKNRGMRRKQERQESYFTIMCQRKVL